MARAMDTKKIFLLTDELGEDRGVRFQFPELSEEEKRKSVLEGLKSLAPYAETAGVILVLEPLNTLVDHAGYWLNRSQAGIDLVKTVNSPNIRLLFDIYHQQITEGNLIERITHNLEWIGHIHVADVPGRHEPGTGEINYANIFARLRSADYQGYVGLEFSPTVASEKAAAEALKLIKG
jgi:hydroxypyruvate isomerase